MMRILGFGDSLTAGTPGYEPGYGGDIRSQYGFWILESAKNESITTLQFHNQGVPGELAIHMRPRLERLLDKESYDLAIIMAGTNDIGWGYTPDQVYDVLRQLWVESASHGIKTIACTIPPIGMIVAQHQRVQRILNDRILNEACQLQQVSVVDVFSALADPEGILLHQYDSGDGLHLSVEGYRRMGETIWSESIQHFI